MTFTVACPMTFTVACLKFFGRKDKQSISEFNAETKALTEKDKQELAPLLSVALGEEVQPER